MYIPQIITPEDVLVLKEMTGSLDRRDLFDKIMQYEAMRSGVPLPMGIGPVLLSSPSSVMPSSHLPGIASEHIMNTN